MAVNTIWRTGFQIARGALEPGKAIANAAGANSVLIAIAWTWKICTFWASEAVVTHARFHCAVPDASVVAIGGNRREPFADTRAAACTSNTHLAMLALLAQTTLC